MIHSKLLLEKIESKPFSMDFDIQLEAAEELYGTQIDFNFNIEDVNAILDSVAGIYSEEICNRIREFLSDKKIINIIREVMPCRHIKNNLT